jgi:hypothetical protein
MHTRLIVLLSLTLLVAPDGHPADAPNIAPAPALAFADVRAFTDAYCAKCHGEQVQKGGLNLSAFPDEKSGGKLPGLV